MLAVTTGSSKAWRRPVTRFKRALEPNIKLNRLTLLATSSLLLFNPKPKRNPVRQLNSTYLLYTLTDLHTPLPLPIVDLKMYVGDQCKKSPYFPESPAPSQDELDQKQDTLVSARLELQSMYKSYIQTGNIQIILSNFTT